jgi:hypothetical protein
MYSEKYDLSYGMTVVEFLERYPIMRNMFIFLDGVLVSTNASADLINKWSGEIVASRDWPADPEHCGKILHNLESAGFDIRREDGGTTARSPRKNKMNKKQPETISFAEFGAAMRAMHDQMVRGIGEMFTTLSKVVERLEEEGYRIDQKTGKLIPPVEDILAEIRALLLLPLPADSSDIGRVPPEFFDPWELFPVVYGSYSDDFDQCAIDVLSDLLKDPQSIDIRYDLAANMFREMLCTAGLCDYGTSPRTCFALPEFEEVLPELLRKWRAYAAAMWGDEE